MIVAKIGADYARELTGANFQAGLFCGRILNKKTDEGPHSDKTISRDSAPFPQANPYCLVELSDLALPDEPMAYFGDTPSLIVTSVLPSGSTTRETRPNGLPFLTGIKDTVTSSPGLKDVFPHPRLTISAGF